MTGSGNDFIMVDGRHSPPEQWSPDDIRRVCARGAGIGADGVVFVAPGQRSGAVRMTYFNSDGSRAALCGNAALCSTRLAAALGLAEPGGVLLETDAGVYESRCTMTEGRAELHLADLEAPGSPAVALVDGERQAGYAVVGVPHLVVRVDDVESIDVPGRGRALRFDPALGAPGANVNFIGQAGRSSTWFIRTYERGIEGETLACGTGAVAAASCLHHWGLGGFPMTLITRLGLPLVIRAQARASGDYGEVWLEGQAALVFRGVLSK